MEEEKIVDTVSKESVQSSDTTSSVGAVSNAENVSDIAPSSNGSEAVSAQASPEIQPGQQPETLTEQPLELSQSASNNVPSTENSSIIAGQEEEQAQGSSTQDPLPNDKVTSNETQATEITASNEASINADSMSTAESSQQSPDIPAQQDTSNPISLQILDAQPTPTEHNNLVQEYSEPDHNKKRVSIALQMHDKVADERSSVLGDDEEMTFVPRHERVFKNDLIKSNLYTWYNKPYMGGFKDAKKSLEYFHAVTQTPTAQEKKAKNAPPKFHRDTQTKYFKNRQSQAKEDNATQMEKPGCYISPANDKIIYARKYTTADEHEAMVLGRIIQIQCFVRQCFAIRLVRKMREEKEERRRAVAEKEKRRKELAEKKRKKELDSRLHPRTKKDFEILYNGLENWRKQETKKINNAGYSEAARLTALADLLDQESALIQKIDRLRIAANEENKEASVIKLLDKMSSPKKWPVTNKKGGVCLVDTPNTIRARELRDLYHALNIPLLSVDERLQILLHVKYTVKEFDCALTRDIVELIDREGDLVSRGRDAKSLEGLRRRISNLFLQFIQTPEFNPEAKAFQKFPDAGESWKKEQAIYYCRGCTKYLASTEFYLSTTMRHLGRCKNCTMKENIANQRKDDSCYVDMLRYAKTMEAAKKTNEPASHEKLDTSTTDYSAISLLQESDIRYLVDIIWNRQSAVSGSKKILDLVLTRWDKTQELSPWNIILLTKEEAHRHETTLNVLDLYSEEFTRRVKQRHLAAKKHFGSLPAMEKYLKENYASKSEPKLPAHETESEESNSNSSEKEVSSSWNSLRSGHSMDDDVHLSIEGFGLDHSMTVVEA